MQLHLSETMKHLTDSDLILYEHFFQLVYIKIYWNWMLQLIGLCRNNKVLFNL